jgi:hypothetical protein
MAITQRIRGWEYAVHGSYSKRMTAKNVQKEYFSKGIKEP